MHPKENDAEPLEQSVLVAIECLLNCCKRKSLDDCTNRSRVKPEDVTTIRVTEPVDVEGHVSWRNDWSIKVVKHSELMETNHHRLVNAKALNQENEKRNILCLDDSIVPTKATFSKNRCQQRVTVIKQIRMYRLHQGSSNHCSFISSVTLNVGNRTDHHCLNNFGSFWFVFSWLILGRRFCCWRQKPTDPSSSSSR